MTYVNSGKRFDTSRLTRQASALVTLLVTRDRHSRPRGRNCVIDAGFHMITACTRPVFFRINQSERSVFPDPTEARQHGGIRP